MTQLLVEGFGTYGTGIAVSGSGVEAVGLAMLSGVWSSIPSFQNLLRPLGIGQLPWDAQNTDFYFYRNMQASSISEGTYPVVPTLRRSVPAQSVLIESFHFATSFLPASNEIICGFQDNSGVNLGFLLLMSSGQLALADVNATTLLAVSSGQVIVSQTDTHLELKADFSTSSGTFEVRANGTVVLNASFTPTNISQIYQVTFFTAHPTPVITRPTFYMSHLICRSTAGSVNNNFVGDRKVATLLANGDDLAHQGWTAHPLRKFGNGVLDLTAGDKNAFTAPNTTATDLGSGDFTLEATIRFNVLPTGANKAVFWGKWDDGATNRRSWQLYKGGPSLNAGATVFQISTAGTAGTVTTVISSNSWAPVTGQYYHLCVERVSAVTTLYIDGQVFASSADGNTYYASSEPTAVGASVQGTSTFLTNTSFNGWMDELRFTVGANRYNGAFTPPVAAFPRGGFDALWANVGLISSFDNGVVADESSHALTLTSWNGALAITPQDGDFNWQVIGKDTPFDGSFLAAAYLQATGLYTLSGVPANNDTVTVGTKTGPSAAVYTWKTTLTGSAFELKIGANVAACLTNLNAAINLLSGAGTLYGTGTTANLDVTSQVQNSTQVLVTAIVPGTAGNSIASTESGANSSWGGTTLSGGVNIPAYSQFTYQRLPASTTVVDSMTIYDRAWKSDAGTATLQASVVGFSGGVLAGTDRAISTVPTVYFDTFEVDPDGGGALTPVAVARAKLKLNRTS